MCTLLVLHCPISNEILPVVNLSTCESYGGKYCPSTAYKIHQMNQQVPAAQKIQLKGMSIGDGAMDPITYAGLSPSAC
jgi:carboxypeptidase C (cathepsin A)